jgi:hypothetical protein
VLKLFSRRTKVEIVFVSGVLTVTVHPTPQWIMLVLEVVVLLACFGVYSVKAWQNLPWVARAIFLWGDFAAIASSFYQLSGSEVIEFDLRGLRIRKGTFGWERHRTFDIEDCKDLDLHSRSSGGDHYALECKAGWRKVRFAEYASQDQASDILSALHENLPEVAKKLRAPVKGYITTLGLGAQV